MKRIEITTYIDSKKVSEHELMVDKKQVVSLMVFGGLLGLKLKLFEIMLMYPILLEFDNIVLFGGSEKLLELLGYFEYLIEHGLVH